MSWAAFWPTLAAIIGSALTLAWKQGKTEQKVIDICAETDQIRDDVRELRADFHMTDWQRSQSPKRSNDWRNHR